MDGHTYHRHTRAPHLKIVETTAPVTKTQADAWTGCQGEANGPDSLVYQTITPPEIAPHQMVVQACWDLAQAIVGAEEGMGLLGAALAKSNGLVPCAMDLVLYGVGAIRANKQSSNPEVQRV